MPLPLYYFNFLFIRTSAEVLEAFVFAGITKWWQLKWQSANESRCDMHQYSCAIFRQNRCYFWGGGGRAGNACSPIIPWTVITINGDLLILVIASPEEVKEACRDSKILSARLSAVKFQINSFVPIILLQFFNYSHLLLVQKKKQPTLLLYSFTCKCSYSNINSKDFTWCLNISSLLECKLYFEYWKIHFPSESRWRRSHPNWIVNYAKKIGWCNIYWMHIKP